MHKQMSFHFDKYLPPYLYGYRKGFSTQEALLSLIEKWKNVLDKKGYGGAMLIDLSKVFDALNHNLLIAKFHAYGFQESRSNWLKVTWEIVGREQRLMQPLVAGVNFL